MIALFMGLVIGFIMCIPIGPINVWVINTHLKKSASRALAIALGGSLMDFVYFFVVLSGLSFIELGETTESWLKMVGVALIFFLGMKELFSKQVSIVSTNKKETPQGLIAGLLLGVVIYTSNPTLLITMTGLGAFVKSLNYFVFTPINIFIVSLGLSTGSFLWFVFLVKVIDRYQEIIRNKYINYFTKVSGGLMVGLSLFMGQKLFS